MRRSLLALSLSLAALVVAGISTAPASASPGQPDFNLDVTGQARGGETLMFHVDGLPENNAFVILASPNLSGITITPFPTPLGTAAPFQMCVGRPYIVASRGVSDPSGNADIMRSVPSRIRPSAVGRTIYFQAYSILVGRRMTSLVSDVESAQVSL